MKRVVAVGISRAVFVIPVVLLLTMTTTISAAGSQAIGSSALTQNASPSETAACSAEIAFQLNTSLGLVNDTKAVQLAEQSAQFLTAVGGSGYQFVGVYGIGTYSHGTCGVDMTVGQVIVAFSLKGETVTSGGVTAPVGISVFENPQVTAVTSVSIDRTIDGIMYWSGYAASVGSDQLYSSEITYDAPSVFSNSNCYYESPYACVMSPWAGLSTPGYLVQSGLNINITCSSSSSCGSEQLEAFWEWLGPSGAGTAYGCSDKTYPVSIGDQITAYEANGLFTLGNGNSNDYIMSVQDASDSWACDSPWEDVGVATNGSLSIIETPPNGCCPIPIDWDQTGVLDIDSNILCPGTTTSSCDDYSSSGVTTSTDYMYNDCSGSYIYNIDVGSLSGGDYTQTYNNNCGS